MSGHGLDRKDEAEIRERAAKIREARLTLNRGKQRQHLTQKQMTELLGDEDGMSYTSRVEDRRQRETEGGGN